MSHIRDTFVGVTVLSLFGFQQGYAQMFELRPDATDLIAPFGQEPTPQENRPALARESENEPSGGIYAFWERQRFDTLTFKFGNGDFDFHDLDRDDIGLRVRVGNRAVGGFFDLAYEQIDVDDLDTTFSGIAVRGGINGDPRIASLGDAALVVDYNGRIGAHTLTGSVDVDLGGGVVDSFDADVTYLELAGRAGLGVEIAGFRPAAGVFISYIDGKLAISPFDDVDFSGTNTGGYASFSYHPPSVPLEASFEFYFGEVRGLMVSAGVSF